MMANYRLSNRRWYVGAVVKENPKTMIVLSPTGKKIKRHRVKHGAVIVR